MEEERKKERERKKKVAIIMFPILAVRAAVLNVDVIQGNLLTGLKRLYGKVDLLIFNPPYVPTDDEEAIEAVGRSLLPPLILFFDNNSFHSLLLFSNNLIPPALRQHGRVASMERDRWRCCSLNCQRFCRRMAPSTW
jgi:hypothetical protein